MVKPLKIDKNIVILMIFMIGIRKAIMMLEFSCKTYIQSRKEVNICQIK